MANYAEVSTSDLRNMADGIKEDIKAIHKSNPKECFKLFRLFKKITAELHKRQFEARFNNN